MRSAALALVLAVTANASPLLPWSGIPGAPLCAVDQPGRTYRVKSGDTLPRISQSRYGTSKYADAIKSANKLSTDKLAPGMILTLPSDPDAYLEEAETPAGTKPAANGKTAKPAKSAAKNGKKAAPGQIATVGDFLDVVAARIQALCNLVGLKYEDGPLFGPKVALSVFIFAFFYVMSDMCIFWFGSMALRFENPSIANAMKVAFGSIGMQGLIVLSFLIILAVSTHAAPSYLSFEAFRSLSLESRSVQWMGGLVWIGVFLFIPVYLASQVYGTSMKGAGLIVVLVIVLKNFIAFFPTANAFLLTGGAQAS